MPSIASETAVEGTIEITASAQGLYLPMEVECSERRIGPNSILTHDCCCQEDDMPLEHALCQFCRKWIFINGSFGFANALLRTQLHMLSCEAKPSFGVTAPPFDEVCYQVAERAISRRAANQ